MYLSISKNILAHRIPNGINIYYDGQPDKCFSINKTAEKIFELCDGTNTKEDIIGIISNYYNGLDNNEVDYIIDFLGDLINENIAIMHNDKTEKRVTVYGNPNIESPTSLSVEITKKCPLRCVHCYTEASSNNNEYISLEVLTKLLDEGVKLGIPTLQLTGGEVFEYSNISDIILKYSPYFRSISISTSGYTLNEEIIEKFNRTNNLSWRISIDGDDVIHNKIRQKNDAYHKAILALKLLKQNNHNVTAVMTISKLNMNLITKVLETVKKYKVDNFEYGFTIKMGRATDKLLLTNEEINSINNMFHKLMNENKNEISLIDRTNKPEDIMHNCGAGWQKLSIQANGDIYPCLSLPIILGNIEYNSIEDIMKSNTISYFQTCTSPNKDTCGLCPKTDECLGCIAKAYSYKENCSYMDNFLEELNHVG